MLRSDWYTCTFTTVNCCEHLLSVCVCACVCVCLCVCVCVCLCRKTQRSPSGLGKRQTAKRKKDAAEERARG